MSDRKLKLEEQKELQEAKRKEAEKNYREYCLSHNRRPMSRRELLGAGLISFSASVTLPTLAGMLLPRRALAQSDECPSAVAGGSGLAPFVTLNLAGGAGLAMNYLPMNAQGNPLSSYDRMGLGDGNVPIEREFGNVPFAGLDANGVLIAKLLTGIRAGASASTLANTAFVAIPVQSRDDFGMNPFDISGMVAKAGLLGSELPNLGRRGSDTGVNQMYAKVKPPTPLVVGSYNDLDGALNLGAQGALSTLSEDQKIDILRLVNRLSDSQVSKVYSQAGGRMLASLVGCAVSKNIEIAEKEKPSVDVRQDGALAQVWGVAGNTNANDERVVFGSMVKAGLMGTAGTVALDKGGYDYHNGTRTTGDQRDQEAGTIIGRTLETAAQMGKKVFIYVTSDGSVVSPVSNDRAAVWQSDRGSAGCSYIIAYDPAGRPATSGFQIGHFTEGQAADASFITGNNPELAASAAFANYLKFNNRMDLLQPVIGSTFSTSQLDQIIKFG